jgi:hypothetical protein
MGDKKICISSGHLPETPCHDFLQKIGDSDKEGYKFRTPDLKTKREATSIGKS